MKIMLFKISYFVFILFFIKTIYLHIHNVPKILIIKTAVITKFIKKHLFFKYKYFNILIINCFYHTFLFIKFYYF